MPIAVEGKIKKSTPMENIIETTQIECDKSSFLIDLVKHSSDKLYVEILQIIHTKEGSGIRQKIRINPVALSGIITALQNYSTKIPKAQFVKKDKISEANQEKIQHHYLIGVSIRDLAMQFNCSKKIIEDVLRNRGISIVSNEIPKTKKRLRWRRK